MMDRHYKKLLNLNLKGFNNIFYLNIYLILINFLRNYIPFDDKLFEYIPNAFKNLDYFKLGCLLNRSIIYDDPII
jgi:hypothetical protein